MITNLTNNDIDLINKLEIEFKDYFNNKKVTDDFKQNVFTRYFIYIENNNILGFVNYYDLYDRYEISYIEVKEEYRNKKSGSKLMDYLISLGKTNHIENITLEVKITNENALKLYHKYDFKEVAIREKYYDGIDGYLMERKMM